MEHSRGEEPARLLGQPVNDGRELVPIPERGGDLTRGGAWSQAELDRGRTAVLRRRGREQPTDAAHAARCAGAAVNSSGASTVYRYPCSARNS